MSPSLIMAIGPFAAASGDICPIQAPLVPPENLPSVIRATFEPSPIPIIALVGASISSVCHRAWGPGVSPDADALYYLRQ